MFRAWVVHNGEIYENIAEKVCNTYSEAMDFVKGVINRRYLYDGFITDLSKDFYNLTTMLFVSEDYKVIKK